MLNSAAARRFVEGEEGASMVEYSMLLALIAIVCLATLTTLGTKANMIFNTVSSSL